MRPTILIHEKHPHQTPIVVGCPFPCDTDLAGGADIGFADGSRAVAQTYPLTNPAPDGVRWWELSFLCSAGGDAVAEPAAASAADPSALACECDGGVVLDNGLLRVTVGTDTAVAPVHVAWQGGQGELTPEVVTDEFGLAREASGNRREIRILRNGPIRSQIEIVGVLVGTGEGWIDYRLTLEIWQAQQALRVDWMLTHRVPGKLDFTVKRAVLSGMWQVGDDARRIFRQNNHSAHFLPRDVVNPGPVTLIADEQCYCVHVSDPAMLLDDSEYPFYCSPPSIGTGEWLELRGETGRVSASVVDFTATRPNALFSRDNELSYSLVPECSPLLWPQGRRKEQHLLLAFAPSADEQSPDALAASAAGLFSVGRAQPAPATLRELGCFDLDRILIHAPGRNSRLSAIMSRLCDLETPATKWDLGDTPDWHYTRGYAGGPNQYMPVSGATELPRAFKAGGGLIFPSAFAYLMEPAWTNNEYDAIHTVATEVMRTGKNDHFQMLRWTARHNVEVDFVSYSDDLWHHRASPFHSHFHNRKGAISSHFWTQGLLQYYCLTGDRDALEVALALGDKIIEINDCAQVRTWKFDREVGWALLALCCLVEAGYRDYMPEAEKIAAYLQGYDRTAFDGAVNLSSGTAGRSLERQMVDCGFGYSPMIEAFDRYVRLTGDPSTAVWLETLLRQMKDAFWEKADDCEHATVRFMVGLVMAIGFERSGDADFLRAGRLILEGYLDPAFSSESGIPLAAGTEGGQSKPCAMAYRGLHRLLGALDRTDQTHSYEYPALREHRAPGVGAP